MMEIEQIITIIHKNTMKTENRIPWNKMPWKVVEESKIKGVYGIYTILQINNEVHKIKVNKGNKINTILKRSPPNQSQLYTPNIPITSYIHRQIKYLIQSNTNQ